MDEEVKASHTLNGWWTRCCVHRRPFLACVFFGWLLVVGAAWVLPAKYKSETLILIEQQRVPEHFVESNIVLDLQQRVQSISEQILSRTRLFGIVNKFHLYGRGNSNLDVQALVDRMRKDISIDLVRTSGGADQITAFKVSYSADNPAIAQQVTAELTSLFIEENLQNRQQLSEDTTSFLEDQLDGARKNLDRQEMRLREFKSRYLGQLPEQNASNVQILAGLQNRLQSANDALHQGEQQRLYLQSLLTQYRAMRPVGTNGKGDQVPTSELEQKLARLRSQLAEIKTKYTSRHPDVTRLEEEVAATEKSLSESVRLQAASKHDSATETPGVSTPSELQAMAPVLQVESQMKANEYDIANRKSEIKQVERDIDAYQARLNLAPAREQELAAITRDHEQSRAYYESLLAKRNQSEMATNLEKRQQGEQFRMIDPPSLPQRPYFPNRLIFSIAGLAFGLAFGIGVVVLREFANAKIYGEAELATVVEAPVVILVPSVLTAAEARSRSVARMWDFAAAGALVLIIPAVTFLLYYKA